MKKYNIKTMHFSQPLHCHLKGWPKTIYFIKITSINFKVITFITISIVTYSFKTFLFKQLGYFIRAIIFSNHN